MKEDKLLFYMCLAACTVLLLTFCQDANAKPNDGWTRNETALLNLAYQEGEDIGHPELLQMLMMNESVVGRYGKIGDKQFKSWKMRSFGVMQIQFRTAREVVDKYTEYDLTDIDLITRLLVDDSFCIKLAKIYIAKCIYPYTKGDLAQTILAYNVGIGNINKYGLAYDPNDYLAKAFSNLKRYITPFNDRQYNNQFIKYKIKRGDTYFKLAKRFLSDGNRWQEIYHLNNINPTKLVIGSTLLIRR